MLQKFKHLLRSEQLFYMTVVILVGCVGYSLGYYAGLTVEEKTAVPAITFINAPDTPNMGTPVVASRNGSKYHHLDCPGAGTIKEANLIKFASVDLAKSAGYTLAGNCGGE